MKTLTGVLAGLILGLASWGGGLAAASTSPPPTIAPKTAIVGMHLPADGSKPPSYLVITVKGMVRGNWHCTSSEPVIGAGAILKCAPGLP